MPYFHVQNIFSGGELSPLMRARADQPAYQGGARELLNMLPMPQGSVDAVQAVEVRFAV